MLNGYEVSFHEVMTGFIAIKLCMNDLKPSLCHPPSFKQSFIYYSYKVWSSMQIDSMASQTLLDPIPTLFDSQRNNLNRFQIHRTSLFKIWKCQVRLQDYAPRSFE